MGGHAWCLKCDDPRVVRKYNQHLLAVIQQLELMDKLDQLHQRQSIKANNIDIINQELTRARLDVECHCRKIKAGGVAWCPLLTQAIQSIQYWKGWLKQVSGGEISNNVMQKRACQACIKHKAHGAAPTREIIMKRLAMAYQGFKRLKGQAD